MSERKDALRSLFASLFGDNEPVYYSAPGRTEICGNHTDHQHGKVLAASVNMDMMAAAAKNGTNTVRVKSGNYPMFTVCLDSLEPNEKEYGTSVGLVRGVCAGIAALGYEISGFDMCVQSDVLQGSGLSSSAAFEILVGAVIGGLFCNDELTATQLAIIGQRSENVFFGKPCGLMDQMASAWGGIIEIDFNDPSKPVVEGIDFDFASKEHSLCMIDIGSDHANLTGEYAAIPAELRSVSGYFGKSALREVNEAEFVAAIPELRAQFGDRAVLRAKHIFDENRRVEKICAALKAGDFDGFLHQIRESGLSSWLYLQNVVVCGAVQDQSAALALALCSSVLGERGAYRIHGGGFGGTVQAFVPNDLLDTFKTTIEAVYGKGSCHVMQIRPVGFAKE